MDLLHRDWYHVEVGGTLGVILRVVLSLLLCACLPLLLGAALKRLYQLKSYCVSVFFCTGQVRSNDFGSVT